DITSYASPKKNRKMKKQTSQLKKLILTKNKKHV
ncbi:MAG: hypothetical protein ACI87N_003016, partial [Flavobacteriales bacterium]